MADNKDIVGGIFGITPELYQRGLVAKDTADNLTAAQLTPGQLAGYYAMEAGSGLGRATAGLLGVEDPQLVKIRDVQSMRGQFDLSTPTGLRQFASALSNKGYGDLAIQASAKAADIDKEISQAEKNRTDNIKQVGLSENGQQVYQTGDQQYVLGPGGQRIPYYGSLQSKTPVTNVTVTGEKAFASKLGTLDAERVSDANKAADNSRTALKTLTELESKKEVISGTGAAARVSGANFLNSLGLINSKDAKLLSNSEQYQKLAKDLVMQDLGGKLGAQISDADRAYVEARIPQLETSPLARQELIQYLKNKHKDVITEAREMDTYARKNNGLGNYEPKTILTPNIPSSSVKDIAAIDARLKALGFNPDGTPIKK